MRIHVIILAYLLINISAFGQNNFGLKANGGISKIHTSYGKFLDENGSPIGIYQKKLYAPSGQFGLFYEVNLGKHSLFCSELLYVQIRGKENLSIHGIESEIDRQISYIGIPFYYGYKIQKFTINIGFQLNLTLNSGGQEKDKTTDSFGNTVIYTTSFDKLNIDNYDYGVKTGITYKLFSKLSIEGLYYYGLNNILAEKINNWKWSNEQATLGLKYIINSTNNKSDSK